MMKWIIIWIGGTLTLIVLAGYLLHDNNNLKIELKQTKWELKQWEKVNALLAREIKLTKEQIENLTFQGSGFGLNAGGCKIPEVRGRSSYSNGNLTKWYSQYAICLPESGERMIWVEETQELQTSDEKEAET